MMAEDATNLLLRAREGDREALGELLCAYRPYVRVLVHAIRAGRAAGPLDDSDLIQDALLAATRGFETFQGTSVGEFVLWLRAITCRTALRTVRRTQLDAPLPAEQLLDGARRPAGEGTRPSEALSRQEQAARLARALENLPAAMREVVLARHVDELPHTTIAERMNSTAGAVRILYMRALRRLREVLEQSDP
jgi:RNA polymerase sigma-70 factor (ECF subfamily)